MKFLKDLFHKHKIEPTFTQIVVTYRHQKPTGRIKKCGYSCEEKERIFYCKCWREMTREEYR